MFSIHHKPAGRDPAGAGRSRVFALRREGPYTMDRLYIDAYHTSGTATGRLVSDSRREETLREVLACFP
jgi:hypothetical protein